MGDSLAMRAALSLVLLGLLGCGEPPPAGPAVRVRVGLIAADLQDPVPRLVFGRESGLRAAGEPLDLTPLEQPLPATTAWAGLAATRERRAPLALRLFPAPPALELHPLCARVETRGQVVDVTSATLAVDWNADLGRTLPLASPGVIGVVRLGPAGNAGSAGLVVWAGLDGSAPSPGPADQGRSWTELALRALERAAGAPLDPDDPANPWTRYGAASPPVVSALDLLVLLPAPAPDGVARLRRVEPALLARAPALRPTLLAARLRAGDLEALDEAEADPATPLRLRSRSVTGPLPLPDGAAATKALDLGKLGPERVFWTVGARERPELAARIGPWTHRGTAPLRAPSALSIAAGAHLLALLLFALARRAERLVARRRALAARAWLLLGATTCLLDPRLAGIDLLPDPLGVLALLLAARRLAAPAWTAPALGLALAAGLGVELLAPDAPWTALAGLPLLLGSLGLLRGLERLHAAEGRPVVAVWCRGAVAVGALTGLAALVPPAWLVLPEPDPAQALASRAVASARLARVALPLLLPALLVGLAAIPPRRGRPRAVTIGPGRQAKHGA